MVQDTGRTQRRHSPLPPWGVPRRVVLEQMVHDERRQVACKRLDILHRDLMIESEQHTTQGATQPPEGASLSACGGLTS